MILLDTNVLSAVLREPPDPAVLGWLDRQHAEEIWTSAVTVFEIRFGLARMAEGQRRTSLKAAFEAVLREELAGRIAPLDRAAAEAAGRLAARREAAGRSVDARDTMIGGIALSLGAQLASRNIAHFRELETGVVDPWAA